MNRAAALASSLLLLAGCAGPKATIGQLGHPAFAPVVGAETAFERADPEQRGGLDAFTDDVNSDADHRMALTFWPGGTEEKIGLEVKARARGKLPLKVLAAAVYPLSRSEAQTFSMTGALPSGLEPIRMEAGSEVDESGLRVLTLIFERSLVPPGAQCLGVPVLAQFKDGWIHVSYYKTLVPEAMKVLSPEEVRQLRKQQGAGASGEAQPETPPAEHAEGAE